MYFIVHMCINCHTFIAFISITFFFLLIVGAIIFVFVFENISPNICICIHILNKYKNFPKPEYICICIRLKNGIQYIHICIHQTMSTKIHLYLGLKIVFVTHCFRTLLLMNEYISDKAVFRNY